MKELKISIHTVYGFADQNEAELFRDQVETVIKAKGIEHNGVQQVIALDLSSSEQPDTVEEPAPPVEPEP